MSAETETPRPSARKKKWLQWLIGSILVLFLLFLILPLIISSTGLRNSLLARIVDEPGLKITCKSARLWYFSPLVIEGLRVSDADGTAEIQVAKLQTEKSCLSLLSDSSDLGSFIVDRAEIGVTVYDNQPAVAGADPQMIEGPTDHQDSQSNAPPLPKFLAKINDGRLSVRIGKEHDELLALDDINLTIRSVREDGGSVIEFEAGSIFDHEPLTRELCNKGLQLVAPMLADEFALKGSLSLNIEKVRIPIGTKAGNAADDLQVKGKVALHNLTVDIKDDSTRRLVAMASEIFGGESPDKLVVLEDSSIQFSVVGDRIHHQGLALVFPGSGSQTIESRGSVGLDKSLNLEFIVKDTAAPDRAGSSKIFRVRGTIDRPQIEEDKK